MPNFAIHTGVNDRFAIGQPREMEIYGSRYLGALDYSKSNLLHAEAYLAHVLEQNSISINLIEFEFMRVRGNGEIENRDSKSRKLTAILYSAKGYSEQLKFFLERGYISDSRYTFIIIAPAQTIQYLRQFPRKNIVLVSREEKGGTFGAWSDILLYNNLYKNYDSFIFLTDECVGPFLPSYNISDWPEFFSKQLGGDVKLVGATINAYCNPKTHAFVDSYCFAMDKDTVSFCIEKGVFSQNYTISALVYTPFFPEQMPEEFVEKTFKMSREIIKAGWNIQSFCKLYEGVDFRFKDMKPEEYNIEFLGQLYGQGNYKGVTLHPYETIFQHILTPIPKLYL